MNASVKIEGLSKSLGGHAVLHDVNLDMAPGEFVVLIGASGSGKTTLLRLVGGLERADAGRIEIDGNCVDAPAERRFVAPERRGLGMVFQEYALWPHLSCQENVTAAIPRGEKRREERARELLESVGVAHAAGKRPHQLSGGQQQRVGLARALAVRPRLLLLDEPLSSLDVDTRDQLRMEIRRVVREAGVAALFVSHDPADAWRLADRVAVLEGGRLVQFDTPEALYRAPATPGVARFTGAQGGFEGDLRGPGIVLAGVDVAAHHRQSGLNGHGALYVRPQGVRANGAADGLPAECLHAVFEAGRYRVYWRVPGVDQPLVSLEDAPPPAQARLRIEPEQAFIFAPAPSRQTTD
ncbi:ABC transporter ATP-binding protein [Acidihalobacter prosperus]|uniref:Ferric iron ABC transporter, ATP-binding protein n=1 Tax=Acidihalobacter prosperus TaxID=160660 RepID=A0A1A6C487_9GAMM|nr:ABC transporter ATP-binding protein [Acidihalobacter prosperus]OBS09355.1 Ferric iron ABC transporter, ATP-binding protein [Acidihalobacter prosperus]